MSDTAPKSSRIHGWLVDVLVGGVVGGITGGIVAVNVVIFSGVDRGYEASLREVLDHSPILGVVVVMVLAAGPVLGVLMARRQRSRRSHSPR